MENMKKGTYMVFESIIGFANFAVTVISIIVTATSIWQTSTKRKHHSDKESTFSCSFISFNTLRQSGTASAKEHISATV